MTFADDRSASWKVLARRPLSTCRSGTIEQRKDSPVNEALKKRVGMARLHPRLGQVGLSRSNTSKAFAAAALMRVTQWPRQSRTRGTEPNGCKDLCEDRTRGSNCGNQDERSTVVVAQSWFQGNETLSVATKTGASRVRRHLPPNYGQLHVSNSSCLPTAVYRDPTVCHCTAEAPVMSCCSGNEQSRNHLWGWHRDDHYAADVSFETEVSEFHRAMFISSPSTPPIDCLLLS
jgi:hypothetical protein